MISVLVADDSLATRRVLSELLRVSGYGPIYTAGSTEEVAEALRAHHPRLALMDLVMPGAPSDMSHIESMVKISPNTVFVVMSAFATPGRVRETIEMGAVYFLVKPFEHQELLEVLSRLNLE